MSNESLMRQKREALQRACLEAGGQKPLADEIGTSQSQVWYWLVRSKRGIPGEFALKTEKAVGVPRYELRPDLYAPPSRGPASQTRRRTAA